MVFHYQFCINLGVKLVAGQVFYAVQLLGRNGLSFVGSDECIAKWSAAILSFLEKNVLFSRSGSNAKLLTVINEKDAHGAPASVVACTDVLGKMMYMCCWSNGFTRKLISGTEAPKTVIRYLESMIAFQTSKTIDDAPRGKNHFFLFFNTLT